MGNAFALALVFLLVGLLIHFCRLWLLLLLLLCTAGFGELFLKRSQQCGSCVRVIRLVIDS